MKSVSSVQKRERIAGGGPLLWDSEVGNTHRADAERKKRDGTASSRPVIVAGGREKVGEQYCRNSIHGQGNGTKIKRHLPQWWKKMLKKPGTVTSGS